MLDGITGLFARFRLLMKWSESKTEVFGKLCGNRATNFHDRLRTDAGRGRRAPGGDAFLRIVSAHRHLGSVASVIGSNVPYVKQR